MCSQPPSSGPGTPLCKSCQINSRKIPPSHIVRDTTPIGYVWLVSQGSGLGVGSRKTSTEARYQVYGESTTNPPRKTSSCGMRVTPRTPESALFWVRASCRKMRISTGCCRRTAVALVLTCPTADVVGWGVGYWVYGVLPQAFSL